jgi:pyridoxine 4-dehydrogenase
MGRIWNRFASQSLHSVAATCFYPAAGALLERIAKAHDRTPKQVALAWLLKRSPIMLPIPGTSSIEHLEENVEAAALRLSDKEYERLVGVAELAS